MQLRDTFDYRPLFYGVTNSFMSLTDIWIIGDSLISHLEEDVGALRGSLNLGLAFNVLWLGTGGMHWSDLIPRFQCTMIFHPPPVMIIIHVGGNDLVTMKQAKLIKVIRRDLGYIASVFPSVKIAWSDILPRNWWRGIENSPDNLAKIDEKRKRINRAGRQVVRDLVCGRAIMHEIDTLTPGLLKPDGVHLTLIGNAIFLNTFEEAVNTFHTNPNQTVYNANK